MNKKNNKLEKFPELYRAALNASIAKQAINGEEFSTQYTRIEYALYCLSNAIEDIANGLIKMQEKMEGKQ